LRWTSGTPQPNPLSVSIDLSGIPGKTSLLLLDSGTNVPLLTVHQISFVTPAATRNDIPKLEVDGLLPTAIFRRVYISYADRFVVLEPW
jgi:hypothetical protein